MNMEIKEEVDELQEMEAKYKCLLAAYKSNPRLMQPVVSTCQTAEKLRFLLGEVTNFAENLTYKVNLDRQLSRNLIRNSDGQSVLVEVNENQLKRSATGLATARNVIESQQSNEETSESGQKLSFH